MLVLQRKAKERIHIGPDIVITVVRIKEGSVRLGIEAPRSLNVVRAEVIDDSGPTKVTATT